MEYILALLLTSSVIFISYRVGKRAGIKEEQLRIESEKNKQWESFAGVVSNINNMSVAELDAWLQKQRDKVKSSMRS